MSRFQVRKKLRKASYRLGTVKTLVHMLTYSSTAIVGLSMVAGSAYATNFTLTSPSAGGALPTGFSPVGGIVLDLIGQNDTRITSQLAANQLYRGYYNSGTPTDFRGNPGTIGIQTGFTSAVTSALGGGIKQAAIRFSLYDGDTASGDFDFDDNTLQVNGINFSNWSSINAQNTDSAGNEGSAGFSGSGFRDNTLDTGWFYSTNAQLLTSFYDSLVNTQQVVYQVQDVDPYDNYYDFTQGISSSLTNVGQGPAVQPNPVPEPFTILGSLAAGTIGVALRRKYQQQKGNAKA